MPNLTASDRVALIKMASELPVGDETRKAILAGLKEASSMEAELRAAGVNLSIWENQLNVASFQKALRNLSNVLRSANRTSDNDFDRRVALIASELMKLSRDEVNIVNLPGDIRPWDFMENPRR